MGVSRNIAPGVMFIYDCCGWIRVQINPNLAYIWKKAKGGCGTLGILNLC